MTPARRRVALPEVAVVARADDGACTPGDAAAVTMAPGLLRLLDGIAGDLATPPGCGFEPRCAIPIGLLVSATEAVLAPLDAADLRWAVRQVDLQWSALPGPDAPLRALATLRQRSPVDARLDVEVGMGTATLARGALRAVPTLAGRYAPAGLGAALPAGVRGIGSAAPPSAHFPDPWPEADRTLFDLRPATLLAHGDGVRAIVYPDLPRLLLRPVAGRDEPLGRRTHPIGGFATSAAVTAARGLLGRQRAGDAGAPVMTAFSFTLRHAITLDDRLIAEAVPGAAPGRAEVRILRVDGTVAATAVLAFAAAP